MEKKKREREKERETDRGTVIETIGEKLLE